MITLYEDNVLRVKTEVVEGDLYIHMDVWIKDREHIENVCKGLVEEVLAMGVPEVFCMIANDDDKLKKFASYYGFVKDCDVDGTNYEVWVKELE